MIALSQERQNPAYRFVVNFWHTQCATRRTRENGACEAGPVFAVLRFETVKTTHFFC
jgi:hypothetical protein